MTALFLAIELKTWKYFNKFWQRYRNTYALENPPFLYPDCIAVFLVFTSLIIALFQKNSIPSQSTEFKIFALVNYAFFTIWLSSGYYKKCKAKGVLDSEIDKYSPSDAPIQTEEQDLLNREKFIEDLYDTIINLPFSDSTVSGLYGSWGEGKTSAINLLKQKLNKLNNEEVEIMVKKYG